MAPENHLSVRAVLAGLLVASGPGLVAAVPNGRLHELAKAAGKLYFGTAVDNPEIKDAAYRPILANKLDFGQVTVGNTQKWQFTEPNQGQFDYRQADEIVNFAKSNGQQIVRCHTLVWHSQLASWVVSGSWNRDSLTRVINAHVGNVAGHFKGQCYAWDVVNEALEDSGSFRNSVFFRVLGTDYLPIAFKAAAAADANAKLYYNDYGIEQAGNKQQQALKIVDVIRRGGARIDGVGLQGHFTVGQTGSRDQLAAVLNQFAAKGVDVAYTEVDVRHSSLPPNARALQQQADDYGNIVGACLAVKRCVGITVWGASDAHSWIPSVFPGSGAATLLDNNMNPKPAYNRVRDVLAAAGRGGTAGQHGGGQGAGGRGAGGQNGAGQGTGGQGAGGQGAPGQGAPGQGQFGHGASGQKAGGQGQFGQGAPGHGASGHGQFGQGAPGQGADGQNAGGQGRRGYARKARKARQARAQQA